MNITQRLEVVQDQLNSNYQQIKDFIRESNPNLERSEIWHLASKQAIQMKASCIFHKKELFNERCLDCTWEEFEFKFEPQQGGIRYEQRQAPLWMYKNLHYRKCWCGKPKNQWESTQQRRYCCGLHREIWNYRIECYWNSFRSMICFRDKGICQDCGSKICKIGSKLWDKIHFNITIISDWEVDHILAICLGGVCYDPKNVRLLCRKCHNKKTGSDFRKLKLKRKKQFTLEQSVS